MNRTIGLTALLAVFCASAAIAQQPADTTADRATAAAEAREVLERSGVVEALDSLAAASAPEIEQALGQLATALAALASRVAGDPELRSSAAQAAQGMVGVAEGLVTEHSRVLQDLLREAAERLEALSAPPAPVREPG